jgi:hypothetical protein
MLIQRPNLDLQHRLFSSSSENYKSIVADAAAAALDVDKIEKAVEMLEQGRLILWSKMREYRSPLDQLHDIQPELAARFQNLSAQLERQAMSSASDTAVSFSGPPLPFEIQQRNYRVLTEEWDKVVAEVRAVDGFQDFLQAIPFETLQQAAAEGPIILLNVSKYRCDAIIVYHTKSPVLIPLAGTSKESLKELVQHFSKPNAASLSNFSREMTTILKELWEQVVQPVVDELQKSGVVLKSRIW